MTKPTTMLLLMGMAFQGLAWAASDVGTSGAAFLKIKTGARPAAMGEAFTAVANDVNAVVWNPAGLAFLKETQITATHSQWFQSANQEFIAAAHPTSIGTFGIGMMNLRVDNIDKRAADTDVADGQFDSNDAAYILSYGRAFGDNLSLGVNATYISQKLDSESASAYAADLGMMWRTPHKPLKLALTVEHLGSKVKFVDESDKLPMTVHAGASYMAFSDRMTMAMDLSMPNDNDMQAGVGMEWDQKMFNDLHGALRAGYTTSGSDVTDDLTGVTAGIGLGWRRFQFDVAWVPYGVLGNTFRYAFLMKF